MKRSILFTAVSLKGEARKEALGCVDYCCSHISQRVREQMMKGQCKNGRYQSSMCECSHCRDCENAVITETVRMHAVIAETVRMHVVIAETVRMQSMQRL